jgi:hypothetical protein
MLTKDQKWNLIKDMECLCYVQQVVNRLYFQNEDREMLKDLKKHIETQIVYTIAKDILPEKVKFTEEPFNPNTYDKTFRGEVVIMSKEELYDLIDKVYEEGIKSCPFSLELNCQPNNQYYGDKVNPDWNKDAPNLGIYPIKQMDAGIHNENCGCNIRVINPETDYTVDYAKPTPPRNTILRNNETPNENIVAPPMEKVIHGSDDRSKKEREKDLKIAELEKELYRLKHLDKDK